jgi:hypothetical protein
MDDPPDVDFEGNMTETTAQIRATIDRMSPYHNPFSINATSLIFHYDFLDFMSKEFKFYGINDNGYFRLDDKVFYIISDPALVMLREATIPNDLKEDHLGAEIVWALHENIIGVIIRTRDTKKALLEINFGGNITVGAPITIIEPASQRATIWDLFTEREF